MRIPAFSATIAGAHHEHSCDIGIRPAACPDRCALSLLGSGGEIRRGHAQRDPPRRRYHQQQDTGHRSCPSRRRKACPIWAEPRSKSSPPTTRGAPKSVKRRPSGLIEQQKVVALIGAFHSSVAGTSSQVAERSRRALYLRRVGSDALTERGFKWFFRTTPNSDTQAQDFFALPARTQQEERRQDRDDRDRQREHAVGRGIQEIAQQVRRQVSRVQDRRQRSPISRARPT